MITVLALVFGAILLVGVVVLVASSGNKGGRQGQSSTAVATEQAQASNPRGTSGPEPAWIRLPAGLSG